MEKNQTFKEIIEQYCHCLKYKYPSCTVIFDGYSTKPSIKDHEHARRFDQNSPYVTVSLNANAPNNQYIFLSNSKNKSQFIEQLKNRFLGTDIKVMQSENDADTMIVNTVINMAKQGKECTVVADDTDVLVLLVHFFENEMANIYFLSEASKRSKEGLVVLDISPIVANISHECKENIIAHAWTGCDTTSSVFGFGKGCSLKLLNQHKELSDICKVFYKDNANKLDISNAGLKIFSFMFKTKDRNLNHARYAMYMRLLSSTTNLIKPERLPPTINAAKYHCYRVYLQINQWLNFNKSSLNPIEWGWKLLDNGTLSPVTTTKEFAPINLLKIIRCSCKSGPEACASNICNCRKHVLTCFASCTGCEGFDCTNTKDHIMYDSSDDNDDEIGRNIFDVFM